MDMNTATFADDSCQVIFCDDEDKLWKLEGRVEKRRENEKRGKRK